MAKLRQFLCISIAAMVRFTNKYSLLVARTGTMNAIYNCVVTIAPGGGLPLPPPAPYIRILAPRPCLSTSTVLDWLGRARMLYLCGPADGR